MLMKLCQRAKSGENDGLALYCKLWTSLAYYYNVSIADFKYKILTFVNFNYSESNT